MRYVAYYRVSTTKQDNGLEAQQHAVRLVLNEGDEIIAEFEDKESGSKRNRAGLNAAIALCKAEHATLLVSKLDRLGRSGKDLHELKDDPELTMRIGNMPTLNTMTFGVLATFAQYEREEISARTKAGLAARKARLESYHEDIAKVIDKGHEYLVAKIASDVDKALKAERKAGVRHTADQVRAVIEATYALPKFKEAKHHHVLHCKPGNFTMTFGEVKLKYTPTEEHRVNRLKALRENALADKNNMRATAYIRQLSKEGISIREIARRMNADGFVTRHGKEFTAVQVTLLAERAGIELPGRKLRTLEDEMQPAVCI